MSIAAKKLLIHRYAREGNFTGVSDEITKGIDVDVRDPRSHWTLDRGLLFLRSAPGSATNLAGVFGLFFQGR